MTAELAQESSSMAPESSGWPLRVVFPEVAKGGKSPWGYL